MGIQFSDFIQWVFYGILTGIAGYVCTLLKTLNNSVQVLNINVAVIVEKTTWHEKVLETHTDKISKMENRVCLN